MKKLAVILALLLIPCAHAQVAVQGSGIQIGGNSSSAGGVTSIKLLGNPPLTGDVIISCQAGLFCNQLGNTISVSIATAFSITSFTGAGQFELGTPVVNPAFTASYSTLPASANITNTDGISSPTALTTPFTSATVTGTFSHSTTATTTFTLTAIQGSTQTATQDIQWLPAIFSGVGASGATSTVTASGTTAVLSTSDALPRFQLGAESVGTTFNLSPSGQVVYLLLAGGSHTFTDANTGFPFAFNAPIGVSFVNAHGVTVSMFLYASTNPLFGNYKPRVAS